MGGGNGGGNNLMSLLSALGGGGGNPFGGAPSRGGPSASIGGGNPADFFSMLAQAMDSDDSDGNAPDQVVPWYFRPTFYNQDDATIIAAFQGATEAEKRAIATALDANGTSVFGHLAHADCLAGLQYLTSGQDGYRIDIKNLPQESPNILIRACCNCSNNVARYLLGLGVEQFIPAFLSSAGTCSPGCEVKEYTDVLNACVSALNNDLALEVLERFPLSACTDVQRYGGHKPSSLAMRAVKRNNLALVRALANKGVDFNQVCCAAGDTAVQWAAFVGATDVMVFLIKHLNINIDAPQGKRNRYLIQEAFEKDHLFTVAVLLRMGASTKCRVSAGQGKTVSILEAMITSGKWSSWISLALLAQPGLSNARVDQVCGDRSLPHKTIGEMIAFLDSNNDYAVRSLAVHPVFQAAQRVDLN